MGLMDKAKGLLKGREKQVKSGIDALSGQVERRAGKHAGKVDGMSHKAKQAVDKLTGAPADVPSAGTPPASTTPTPPTSTTPASSTHAGTTPTSPPPDAPPI